MYGWSVDVLWYSSVVVVGVFVVLGYSRVVLLYACSVVVVLSMCYCTVVL